MPIHIKILTALVITIFADGVSAQHEEKIKTALGAAMPQLRIDSVRRTPFAELYEVVANGQEIFYTDVQGDVAFFGRVVDLKNKVNLTEQRALDLRKIDFTALPLDKAIVKVKGDGRRKLAVFSDPDCPYCKQLEPVLDKVENVTIYTFLYPLTQIHPQAPKKATMIWCAPDRLHAWNEWMLFGRLPEKPTLDCGTPIYEIADLAESLGVKGTPGLVFENGRLVPGVPTVEQIEAQLSTQLGVRQ